MNSILSAVLLSILAQDPAPTVATDAGVLAADAGSAKLPMFASVHHFQSGGATDALAAPSATALKALAADGKLPVRMVAAADVDGDGRSELVVARERVKSHKLDLLVFRTPQALGEGKLKLLRSTKKGGLGPAEGEGSAVAIAGLDVAGDGIDELAILRIHEDGSQWIEIRPLPSGKNKPLGPIAREIAAGGPLDTGAVRALAGVRLDAVAGDELALVSDSAGAPQRIAWYGLPASIVGALGAPLAEDLDADNAGAEPAAIEALFEAVLPPLLAAAPDERGLALVRRLPDQGLRFALHRPALDGELGAALTAENLPSGLAAPQFAFGVDRPLPPPEPSGGPGQDPSPLPSTARLVVGSASGGGDVIHLYTLDEEPVTITAHATGGLMKFADGTQVGFTMSPGVVGGATVTFSPQTFHYSGVLHTGEAVTLALAPQAAMSFFHANGELMFSANGWLTSFVGTMTYASDGAVVKLSWMALQPAQ